MRVDRFESAAFAVDLEPPAALPRSRALLGAALAEFGLPAVDGAASPKDDAIGLLMLAAEVEHALMVQYLYAAQSVRGAAGRTIAHVAVQEMGHMLTVQNLLLALTGVTAEDLPGGFHFGRDGLRRASARNPLPLVLEPVSHGALAKFVVVEQPSEIADAALKARVVALEAEVAALGVHPNPVHALYAAILWIFLPSDDADPAGPGVDLGFKAGWHLQDANFSGGGAVADRFAATPEEWGSVPGLIIAPIRNRDDGLVALHAIAAQGEGLPGAAASHFQDFLRVLDTFEAGQVPVAGLPRTPHTATQATPEDPGATLITAPYTLLWADLFNLGYEVLILDLAWAISQPHDQASRVALIDLCIDSMRSNVIKPLSNHLAQLPIAATDAAVAGPPFGLAQEAVPETRAGFADRYDVLMGARDALIQRLKAAPDFAADLQGQLLLEGLADIDARRAPHLPGAP